MDVTHPEQDGSSILASFTRAFLGFALSARAADALVREVLDVPLDGLPARLSYATSTLLWTRASAASSDADVGLHFVEKADTAALGVVGYLARASATLGDAFERIEVYHRVFKDPTSSSITRRGDEISITEGPPAGDEPWPRAMAEAILASYVVFARKWVGVGGELAPLGVGFQHPMPDRLDEHVRIFGSKPRFGEPTNTLVMSTADGARPFLTRDDGLVPFLVSEAGRQHEALGGEGLRTRVERAVAAQLSRRDVTLESVAQKMGLGARTLQRRLSEDGTSFQRVLDDVRRREARHLLEELRLSAAEASFLLGFAGPSSFSRALRRWRRTTPSRASDTD